MDIVVVGGPHSGVGKTLAAEIALQALRQYRAGAIKLTVADGERDPAHDHGPSALALADAVGICGRGASCGVCETVSAKVPSRLITHQGAICKPNTDTCRLYEAGAIAVAWVIALREAAPDAVARAIEYHRSRGAQLVLIEGTTALEWLSPQASVLVATDPGRSWKAVALQYVGSCDIVLRNALPVPSGALAAPKEFALSNPLDCNLGAPADAGTLEYVRRLRALCGVSEPASSAASEAKAGR